ncbi:GH1 family beta-glucosidase [Allosalinactinospora lopnorensis]|uniref:GH1 family beta-glucosidase n=1 Tax=Allosalinactinospora lopnorensis TaxID=1352348 RepID=UPI000623BE79|nr:GH1 family beta-glucosidase [Allosalinactinospora lopnorensis]
MAAPPLPQPEASFETRFPADFAWGAATAAFQIEGATRADGRGVSIWDTFSATPGHVIGGGTGEPASDHYRRYTEDVALLKSLGIGNYRFSLAWPRIQPDGTGPGNPAGLDFYDRLVDELLAGGIEPWPTLYHWDLPQPLEDAGGWPARDTALRFADYAETVYGRLGDRVGTWCTVNEPWVIAFLGYASGEHAPGRREPASALAAVHHLLLAHGLAAAAIRDPGVPGAPAVGIALNPQPIRPHSGSVADLDAARRVDGVRNRIFLDPLYHGRYPDDVQADLAGVSDFAFVRDGDLPAIAAPLDFLGVNYYSPASVTGAAGAVDRELLEPDGADPSPLVGCENVGLLSGAAPRTDQDWEVDASGLTELLVRLAVDYPGTPLYVTENGASYRDEIGDDGAVHDPRRVSYLDQHVRAAHAALAAGAPVKGYFVWSLLDNFEWAYGYRERFGIIYVDYDTQRRIVKDSGRWYGRLASTGAVPPLDGSA